MTAPRFNPHLLEVPLYIAGKSIDEVKEELGLAAVVKLASNESPIGPSPLAIQAAQRLLAEAHHYPGVADCNLRRKLAARLGYGLAEDNILLANGGTDALRMITQAFVFDGGNTVMSQVTFPMYRILTVAFGGTPKIVAPSPDYGHDLATMAGQLDEDTRIVFLCSPNNPTGDILTQAQVDHFLAAVPEHVVVVFDESYYDYVADPRYAQSLSSVEAGRNVLVLRSFSKSAGLANLRVGYVIGPAVLVEYIRHTRLPFHVGDIALAAASASLDDTEYHRQGRQAVLEGRAYLLAALRQLKLCCLPSQANFVTILDPPLEVTTLVQALLRKGIIVRPLDAFGLPNGIRVSVGTQADNEKFIQALANALPEATYSGSGLLSDQVHEWEAST
ncbi:MAG TPA: histidinol-phosphate transaminase [Anaerolineae bacterium]